MLKNKSLLLIATFTLSFLTACSEEITADKSPPKVYPYAEITLAHEAPLLRSLPEKTVGYIRIPNLIRAVVTPQADALYPAMSDAAFQQQGDEILSGLRKNVIGKIEDASLRSLAETLLTKQAGPIELAIMGGAAGLITPDVLLRTKLELSTAEEFSNFLDEAIKTAQGQLKLSKPIDETGNFVLSAQASQVYGYFDLSTQSLVIYTGAAPLATTIKKFRTGELTVRTDLYNFEQQFDQSGSGFAVWADTESLWSQLSPLAPPTYKQEMESLNVQDTKFLYLGSAAKSGKASLRMHLQYKENGKNLFHFPSTPTVQQALLAPPVSYVATLPWINSSNIKQLIEIEKNFSDEKRIADAYADVNGYLESELQISLDQIISVFGSTILTVEDRAGTWVSIPVSSKPSFDQLIELTKTKFGATLESKDINGLSIKHYIFPGLTKLIMQQNPEEMNTDDIPAPLVQLLAGENTHIYWVEEADNLIMAAVPQVLMARERHKSISAQQWLAQNAVNQQESLLSFTLTTEDLSRKAYHVYLGIVQSFSDIAGVSPNLYALPLAEDLGLSGDGRVAISINTGANATSLVMDYEQHPLDYFGAGGSAMTTVAVVGILAAVAIPAYQDYVVRVSASEVFSSASLLQSQLEAYYRENNGWPDDEPAKLFMMENDKAVIFFDPERGSIRMLFNDTIDPRFDGAEVVMAPSVGVDGGLSWNCVNISAPNELISSACRN